MNNDTIRTVFEKWHSDRFEQHLPSLRTEYGYDSKIVHQRWVGFQGAYNLTQADEQGDEELDIYDLLERSEFWLRGMRGLDASERKAVDQLTTELFKAIKLLRNESKQENNEIKRLRDALQEIVDNEASGFHDATLHAATAQQALSQLNKQEGGCE